MVLKRALAPLLALAVVSTPGLAQPAAARTAPAPPQAGSAEAAVGEFIAALNAMDAARLGRLFAEDATIFFPSAPFPLRRLGKAEAVRYFARLFEALRARGARLSDIVPRELHVQLYGDAAVASFHLTGGQELGRRTLVLRRLGGRWLIVHLHSSSLRAAPPPPPAQPQPTPLPAQPPR